jgi:hypothetical protein
VGLLVPLVAGLAPVVEWFTYYSVARLSNDIAGDESKPQKQAKNRA